MAIERIVILGGGTAGWLSACTLAAARPELRITLVEAPDIPTIGVGEGTWPTMRSTLASIGINETEFLVECDASFKQGSRFDGWVNGAGDDSFLHPFTPPPQASVAALLAVWGEMEGAQPFASAMTSQQAICDRNLAPRQRAMPPYQAAQNYAYHLDAGKFAKLLKKHATERLGVIWIADHVISVVPDGAGGIQGLQSRTNGLIEGEFFLDCSGHAGLLIGDHLGVPWLSREDVSFNDRALAVQVPTNETMPIASQTIGTAHEAGWLWDIALPERNGLGCVYSSRFMDDGRAEEVLRDYIVQHFPETEMSSLGIRKLSFRTGHRERFWQGNCIAIGLSAGFIEPLEASAIVMIELSLKALKENFPASREAMDIHARRFNARFRYRWDGIVDFLKLHYVLSERTEPYWLAQRDEATIPSSLSDLLRIWRDQPPSEWDFPQIEEIFPAASYQFVLYGMGFARPSAAVSEADLRNARTKLEEVARRTRALTASLPTNRAYFSALAADRVPTIKNELNA